MRCLLATVLTLCLGARLAAADPEEARERAAQADTAAAAGDNDRALALYKQALALHDAPRYRCNVGIAYYKVKDWPRAHLFLAMCLAHTAELEAAAVSQMGRAYAFAERQLAAGAYGQVAVHTSVPAVVTVSAFADDESFPSPRTIWLPHGEHSIVARAGGYHEATADVTAGASASRVDLELAEKPAPKAEPDAGPPREPPPDAVPRVPEPRPRQRTEPAAPDRTRAWIAFGVAGAALASGGLFHGLALDAKRDAEAHGPGSDFNRADRRFKRHRIAALAGYAVALTAAAAGVYLWPRAAETPTVSLSLDASGASVAASWHF